MNHVLFTRPALLVFVFFGGKKISLANGSKVFVRA